MAKKPDLGWQIITAALSLAADKGWRRLTVAEIADAAKTAPEKLYELFPSKRAILTEFSKRIDDQAFAGGALDGESVRDDLFELMMRRFELLQPHKVGLRAVMRDTVSTDPPGSLCGLVSVMRCMARLLEGSGVRTSGVDGCLKTKLLALTYVGVGRTWLNDDTDDLSRTMAALDGALKRLERWAQVRPLRPGRGSAEAAPEAG